MQNHWLKYVIQIEKVPYNIMHVLISIQSKISVVFSLDFKTAKHWQSKDKLKVCPQGF